MVLAKLMTSQADEGSTEPRYQSVKSMLMRGLDRQPLPELVSAGPPIDHANIRGADYYAVTENVEEVAG